MKKVLFILTILFVILCFVGGGYVIFSDGQANAGYAIIPMLFAPACSQGYKILKKAEKQA